MLSSSNPLPPITRLEETHQTKRCQRLRRTIQRSISALLSPYYIAYEKLKPYAVDIDLEKYFDIYEISRTNVDEAQTIAEADSQDMHGSDGLQDLKMGLQRLHMIRKPLLCTLLALGIDGSQSDVPRWTAAVGAMSEVVALTSRMTYDIDSIMREEEGKVAKGQCFCAYIDRGHFQIYQPQQPLKRP